HKMPLGELEAMAPNFDWAGYLRANGVTGVESLNVAQPEFFRTLSTELNAVPLADWKSYLTWHLARSQSPVLSSKFVNEDFHFSQQLTGAKVLLPRWKRCLQLT